MQQEVINDIKSLVDDEDPEILFLAEVKDGWQKDQIIKKFGSVYPYYNFSLKYPIKSLLRFFWVVHSRDGKMVFSKSEIPLDTWHLRNGTETGVFEIKLQDNLVILMTHLSLTESTRRLQHKEVLERYKNNPNVVWLGDFNHTNDKELSVIKDGGFDLVQCDGHTFPAIVPSKSKDDWLWWLDQIIIDYFFPSLKERMLDLLFFKFFSMRKNFSITACVLRRILSDHLPVVWKIKRGTYPQ